MEIMRQYRILVVDDNRSICVGENVLELDAMTWRRLDRMEELELTDFL